MGSTAIMHAEIAFVAWHRSGASLPAIARVDAHAPQCGRTNSRSVSRPEPKPVNAHLKAISRSLCDGASFGWHGRNTIQRLPRSPSKKRFRRLAISLPIFANQVERGKTNRKDEQRRFSMRLKGQLTRLLMVGGLAVMAAGISEAGGCCIGCEWCGAPAPRAAVSQAATAQPSLFSVALTILSVLI